MLTATVAALSPVLSFGVSGLLHSPGRDLVQLAHRAAVPLSFSQAVVVASGGLRMELKALSWNAEQVLIEFSATGTWAKRPYTGSFWASRRTVTQFLAGRESDGTAFQLTLTPLSASFPAPEAPRSPQGTAPGAAPELPKEPVPKDRSLTPKDAHLGMGQRRPG